MKEVTILALTCLASIFKSRANLHVENLALRHQLCVLQRSVKRSKVKPVDPFYYPRIKGAAGIFRVPLANVENHMLVAQAMSGEEELKAPKPKVGDFAAYLIKSGVPG